MGGKGENITIITLDVCEGSFNQVTFSKDVLPVHAVALIGSGFLMCIFSTSVSQSQSVTPKYT